MRNQNVERIDSLDQKVCLKTDCWMVKRLAKQPNVGHPEPKYPTCASLHITSILTRICIKG